MPTTMHHTIDWLLWRTLHLLFTIFLIIGSAFSRGRRILRGAIFTTAAAGGGGGQADAAVEGFEEKAKGVAVAVVFESLEGLNWEGKVSQLVSWLSAINVSHVTLFDPAGVLKRSQAQLETTLKILEGRRDNQLDLAEVESCTNNRKLSGNDSCSLLQELSGLRKRNGEHLSGEYGQGQMIFGGVANLKRSETKIELLSLLDGKEALVRAARTVCENAYKHHYAKHHRSKLPKLTEQDVNESLQVNGTEGPDPDLLLLFGKTRSLHGFPPWRLRLTEIVHVGSLQEMSANSLVAALKEFSKKTHSQGCKKTVRVKMREPERDGFLFPIHLRGVHTTRKFYVRADDEGRKNFVDEVERLCANTLVA